MDCARPLAFWAQAVCEVDLAGPVPGEVDQLPFAIDPLEIDEGILRAAKSDECGHAQLRRMLDDCFARETEIHPNRIELHSVEELRKTRGVDTLVKEQRSIDQRPKSAVPSKSLSPKSGEAANLPHTP